ncbi:uncharacterized protein LOC134246893, partial [Saccostrea cucullata]|uniref:uncharacterized protein LOC134246893 n=1 Tax=Saccostrea cuccullata TaxID=36930 RepID=UPI002ED2A093
MAYGLNPNEGRSRFAKLGMAINDELSQAYRDILKINVDPKDMNALVKSEDIFRNLSANQRLLLSQTATSGYKELDISLMYKLLRNICKNIPQPTNGWGGDSMPKEGENTVGDDIERIRLIRNDVFGHVSSASTTKDTFDKCWLIISKVCTRLQLYTGKNYLNGLQNIREQSLKKEDELAEIEKIKNDCQRDVELRDLIMSLKKDVQELKEPTKNVRLSGKNKLRHVFQMTFKAKDSQRKHAVETVTNNIKDGINFMIDSIHENSTEEDIYTIQESLKKFLEKVDKKDVIDEMLTKMRRKMEWFSSLHPKRQISIFQKFINYLWDLSSKYELESLQLKFGSILFDLTFVTEDGYNRLLKDVKNGMERLTLVKIFCDSELLSTVGLHEEEISIFIAPYDEK